jgi:Invasin, domain 3
MSAIALVAIVTSCDENLPTGPEAFAATLQIVAARDTVVVGDSNTLQARATDGKGRVILGLKYAWTSADTSLLSLATSNAADTDAIAGRKQVLVGKRPGLSRVTMSLPDTRFLSNDNSRNETVVVGGVRILTTHDTTLTAINDTGFATAAGLVKASGALVTRPSQGIKWVHRGDRTQIVGTGDTIRYISKANGADTLIAMHDFCLADQKCADTVVIHVAQRLNLALTTHAFDAWSFSDSVGPSIALADRRGTGQAGTSIRFVPRSASDSAIVKVTPAFGTSDPVNGAMAVPKLVTAGNGLARILVEGLASDGITVVATDSVTVTVRQVARRIAAEAAHGDLTVIDSIPIRGVARDARGATIADAELTLTSVNIGMHDVWIGPTATPGVSTTIVPELTGIALPSNNPGAPQIAPAVDVSVMDLVAVDTLKASALKTINILLVDSLGQPGVGKWVRFGVTGVVDGAATVVAVVPDSVQAGADGIAHVIWTLPTVSGSYTMTGVRGTKAPMDALADSLGRIVIRHSVEVTAADPDAVASTLAISRTTVNQTQTATVTVTVKDKFGNLVKDATIAAGSFVLAATGVGGTFSNTATCTDGVCTVTYTPPTTAGAATISAKINGVEIVHSPINITITNP